MVVTWIEVHITAAQLGTWPPKLLLTNEAALLWAMCLALQEGEWVATPIIDDVKKKKWMCKLALGPGGCNVYYF